MKFSDIYIGQKASIEKKLTFKNVNDFVLLSGDINKIHTNIEYAKSTIFKIPIVHGALLIAYISSLIGNTLPGDGAIIKHQNIRFVSPAKVGDLVVIEMLVIKLFPEEKELFVSVDIHNQDGNSIIYSTATIKALE